jgi:hypothetical protein
MNYNLKNFHKIGPVYIILLTLLIWNINEVFSFLRKYSDEYYIKKSVKDYKYKRMIMIRETFNFFEKCIILGFQFAIILGIALFIAVLTLTITYLYGRDNSETDLNRIAQRDKNIKILSLISFFLYMVGTIYKLGDLLLYPLFYSIEKKFISSPIKPNYYKLLYVPNESPYLCEIKEMYKTDKKHSDKSNAENQEDDIDNAKTNDIEKNEDERTLIKVQNKEEME